MERTDEAGRFAWAEEVAEAVTGEARGQGLGDDEVYYLGAALREALLNALSHGRDPAGDPWVRVDVTCNAGRRLVVTVLDRGPGFDPEGVPDPCAPERAREPCGRGLYFMRCFTDRVSFSFPDFGGSRIRLEKRLPGSAPDEAATAEGAAPPGSDRKRASG